MGGDWTIKGGGSGYCRFMVRDSPPCSPRTPRKKTIHDKYMGFGRYETRSYSEMINSKSYPHERKEREDYVTWCIREYLKDPEDKTGWKKHNRKFCKYLKKVRPYWFPK